MGHVGLSRGVIDETRKNEAGENCSQKFRYSHGIKPKSVPAFEVNHDTKYLMDLWIQGHQGPTAIPQWIFMDIVMMTPSKNCNSEFYSNFNKSSLL